MWSMLLSLFPSILNPLLNTVAAIYAKKTDSQLEGFKTATGVDAVAFQAYLHATLENNRLVLSQRVWWGARAICLIAGIPASFHFAAVMLDSTFKLGCGHYGCLGIPKIPAPY